MPPHDVEPPRRRSADPPRVLVLLLATRRDASLADVLAAVPASLRAGGAAHFLAVGFAPERADVAAVPGDVAGLTRLDAPAHLAIGAYQKLGLRFAVDEGYDAVVQLRSDALDGAPALAPLAEALARGAEEVVLGVRRARTGARGAKDRAVRGAVRALAGRDLADPLTPLRGFATSLLARVPFEVDANDARFELQLLLQALHVGARVAEIPVDAPAAAPRGPAPSSREVLGTTLQYKLHQLGMLCSLKYRGLEPDRYVDKTSMVYSSHRAALDVVRELEPNTVLDLGSGRGYVARRCEEMGAEVTGVDVAEPPPGTLRRFIVHDLNRPGLPVDPFSFDCVLMLDVVEHLSNPEDFLVDLRNASRAPRERPGKLVLSTPNVAFAALRANLLLGRFNYAERGILDTTHTRLFTLESLRTMLEDCGYEIDRIIPVGVPFEAVIEGPLGRALARPCDALARLWPTLFAFQIMVVATPTPGVRQLLEDSPRVSVRLAPRA